MSSSHVYALTSPRKDLTLVAKRHFEAYVKGIPVSSAISEHTDGSTVLLNNTPLKGISQSNYARAVNSKACPLPPQMPISIIDRKTKEDTQMLNSDERLFLRLPENDTLRTLSGYALQTLLKTKLGPHGHLLANTHSTKTGFALCPTKGKSEILAENLAATRILKDKEIERAFPWKSYRISDIPRKLGTSDEYLKHHFEPVTNESLTDAIATAVGSPPYQ